MGRRHIAFIAAIALLAAWRMGTACPHCNIHMYLSEGVRTSENIVVVRVTEATNHAAVAGEVVRAIVGQKKPGDRVPLDRLWGAPTGIGEKCIVLDGMESNGFDVLPATPDAEEEVVFLRKLASGPDAGRGAGYTPSASELRLWGDVVKRDSLIRNTDQAVRLAQGMSAVTKACALGYLQQHREGATQSILKALAPQKDALFSPKHSVDFWRIRGLCEALMAVSDAPAQDYALRFIDEFCAARRPDVDFGDAKSFLHGPSEWGEFLLNLLRGAPDNIRAKMTERLFGGLARAQGLAVADAAYALSESGIVGSRPLPPAICASAYLCDYAVLGLMWAAGERAGWWDKEPALNLHKLALETARDPRLRDYVEKARPKFPF